MLVQFYVIFTSLFDMFCLRSNFHRIFEISRWLNFHFETRFDCFYSENYHHHHHHFHQLKYIVINNNELQATNYNTTIINIKYKLNLQIYTWLFQFTSYELILKYFIYLLCLLSCFSANNDNLFICWYFTGHIFLEVTLS